MLALAIVAAIAILVLGAIIIWLIKSHVVETKDLHLRLASKSIEDYHYWRDVHPLEVENNRIVLEKIREEKGKAVELTPAEKEARERAKGF
jgi:hypothetical protein